MSDICSLQASRLVRGARARRIGHALVAVLTLACSTACGTGLALVVAPSSAGVEDELVETKAYTASTRRLCPNFASTTVGAPAPARRRTCVSTGAASSKTRPPVLLATYLVGAGVNIRC